MTVTNGYQGKCHIWSPHKCVTRMSVFRWVCRQTTIQGAEGCTPLLSDYSEVSQVKFICIAHESHSVCQRASSQPVHALCEEEMKGKLRQHKQITTGPYSWECSLFSKQDFRLTATSVCFTNPHIHKCSAAYLCNDRGQTRRPFQDEKDGQSAL